MSFLHGAVDLVLHLDRHLSALLGAYGLWLYPIVFAIIFAETGCILTAFLPGDSLLFALGALTAIDRSGTLRLGSVLLLLVLAAVAGNSLNYAIGRRIGRAAFSGDYAFIRVEYLRRTERYFERYGALTVLLSLFIPIIRTFSPFVAGIGRMPLARFQLVNVAGASTWVVLFVLGGFAFGNLPWIRDHFGLITLLIIVVSVVPALLVVVRGRRDRTVTASATE
jgi:membrane-associated protein